jgi:DNA-binding response OmpR family regulator
MPGAAQSKILLIDDDTSLLVTLSDFLRFEGYEVQTADSGEQGLQRLEAGEPDLIILDMSMPGMGGIGFLRAISDTEGRPRYPVLVLTARSNMAEFFADVDVDGFVAKPCNPEDLLMEVARIIFLRKGAHEPAAAVHRKVRAKVLIGEDEHVARDALARAFTRAGYVVDAVGRGPDVLEKTIVEKPDIVIVKRGLPRMDGDTVLSMLREMANTRSIPVVLYDESDEDTVSGWRADADSATRRFVKGNNPRDVLAAAEELVGV